MSIIQRTDTICRGCLATDRTLTSIENYYHIYHKIIMDSKAFNSDLEIPLMCWECNANFKKFEMFWKKVLEADMLLSDSREDFQFKTLSTLTISIKQNIIDLDHSKENTKHNTVYDDNKKGDVKVNLELKGIEIELKQEPTEYKQVDDYDDYSEPLDISDFLQNNEIIADSVKIEPPENIPKQTVSKTKDVKSKVKLKKKEVNKNYRVIELHNKEDNTRMYETVRIDEKEMAYWMEQEKTKRSYKKMAYKCEICISGFAKEKYYLKHVRTFHNEEYGQYVCNICHRRLRSKHRLVRHVTAHYTKYACGLCAFQCYHVGQIDSHLLCQHRRAVECLKCGLQFTQFPHFYEHFRRLHKKFVCDHCKKGYSTKIQLIKHIRKYHGVHRCEKCNKTYSTFDTLVYHNSLRHVKSASELCYCVECDIQFDNVTLYRRHIKMSVKHRQKPGIPCPECDKVYHRRCSMVNHYNHVHLKKTKHYCQLCDKYFLNGFRIRQHIASIHDKVPRVKDKMCPYCARGFSTNRILENHIRTHTGERPFECAHCPASFTQRQALVSHTRAIHKIH